MIEARGLSRAFGERTAVENVSFELRQGTLCALLGPNGGGKTTPVRMLLGLIRPTRGDANVAGFDVPGSAETMARLRARVGLLTETPGFYDRLSGAENLLFFAELYGLAVPRAKDRMEHWLRKLDLWDRRDDLVATYSKGMKQRLAIARAVHHEPDVIFFDEPTAGLDPESAKDVRELIGSLKESGRTIIVCTHNLAEAEELADVIAVLERRLLVFGTPEELIRGSEGARVDIVISGDAELARAVVAALPGIRSIAAAGTKLEIGLEQANRATPVIVRALTLAGFDILEVRPGRRSLEEVYLDAIARNE